MAKRSIFMLTVAVVLLCSPGLARAQTLCFADEANQLYVIQVTASTGVFFSVIGEMINPSCAGPALPSLPPTLNLPGGTISGTAHFRADGLFHIGLAVQSSTLICFPYILHGVIDSTGRGDAFLEFPSVGIFGEVQLGIPFFFRTVLRPAACPTTLPP